MSILILADHNGHSLKISTRQAVTAAKLLGDETHLLLVGANLDELIEEARQLSGVNKVTKTGIKLIDEEIKPTTTHVNAFWPTKNTTFDKSWKKYTLEDIERRNEMRKLGHYLEEKKHSIHDSLLTHNVQLYNSKNFNSSIFWLGYWAISHAFWSLHYTKRSFDEYKKWLNEWVDISFNWYNLSFEDETGEKCFPLNRFSSFIEENHAFLKIPAEINLQKGMKIKILRVAEKTTWREFKIWKKGEVGTGFAFYNFKQRTIF